MAANKMKRHTTCVDPTVGFQQTRANFRSHSQGSEQPLFEHNSTANPPTLLQRRNMQRIFAWLATAKTKNTTGADFQPIVECLEDRQMLSVTITLDYSTDTSGFFDVQERRDAFEEVAADLGATLNDSLSAINTGGSNTYSAQYFDPATGDLASAANLDVAQDEIVVFTGARSYTDNTLAEAGPGGWFGLSGSSAFVDAVATRGQSGVSNNTDFARWGGSVAWNENANWNFSDDLSDLDANESDFRSVAYHELLHVLGFGTAASWDALVSNGEFVGVKATAEYDFDGSPPLTSTGSHFDYGVTDNGQEVAMDPDIARGTRKFLTLLDYAAIDDIGWDVTPPSNAIGTVIISGTNLMVTGTSDSNLIEVRQIGSQIRILIDSYDHGLFAQPTGEIVVEGLAGDDTINFQAGVTVDGNVNGGAGNDVIRTGAGDDKVFGGTGNDTILGRAGNDEIEGQSGIDTLKGQAGNDTIRGGSEGDSITGGTGNDDIFGGAGIDNILGNSGNDTIDGGDGGDIISGGSGDDEIDGGDGNDQIQGLGGADTINAGFGNDTIFGGGQNDLIYGDFGTNMIYGDGGNDVLYGGSGVDTIYGGVANDFIYGFGGGDFIYGESGIDEIHGGLGSDLIDGGGSGDMLYGDVGADEIHGGAGDDLIEGGSENDQLFGDGGDDDIFGGDGNDLLEGSFGSDLLNGQSGTDTSNDFGERGTISIENTP